MKNVVLTNKESKIMDYTIFFVKLWDGADDLLHSERRGLNVLKQELESMLKKILTQQQVKKRPCWIYI